MGIKTTRFDPMEYLDTDQDHVDLLNEALSSGDPRLVIGTVSEIARARGMTELSRLTGIGRSSLYSALADDANPTLETLLKVLTALKLQLQAKPATQAA